MSKDDRSTQGTKAASDALSQAWTELLGAFGSAGGPFDLALQSLEPRRWLGPAWSGFDQPFESFLGLPRLAAFPTVDRQILALLTGWMALAQRYGEYSAIVSRVWGEAYADFATDKAGDGSVASGRELLDRWTAIVNRKLLKAQRSDELLGAQRRLMDALLSSRGLERNVVEMVAQAFDLPTRTEIDDVHRALHSVKRELRALRRQQEADRAQAEKPAPSIDPAPPRNSARTRKGRTTNGRLGEASNAD